MDFNKKLHKKKLEICFNKFSKNIFITDFLGNNITFGSFFTNTLKVIDYFKKKGIKKNSKILILSENCSNYLVVLAACLLGGYVACPVDPTIKSERLKKLKKIYKIDYVIKNANELNFEDCIPNLNLISYEDTDCLIVASSGTLGEPQGILFTSNSIIESSQSFSKLANYNNKTKILHCLPMFYMGGILDTFFSCMFSGSTIILGERFSISNVLSFWDLPIRTNCNVLFLTPTIVAFICAVYKKPKLEIKKHVSKYKSIFATGSSLYPEIREKFNKIFNKKIFSCYGATELVGPIAIQGRKDSFLDFCVGTHSSEVKISIKKDQEGKKIIMIKAPFFMKGYLTESGLQVPKTKNGYYDTEDIGDYKNGLLFITGRKRNIIKKGGELVSLALIESTAKQNDHIVEAVALGKKDMFAGEEPYLIVTVKQKYSLNQKIEEITNFLSKKLRPIEMPKKIIITKKLPKNNNGEILKDSLFKLLKL